jgi:hypothetical protein
MINMRKHVHLTRSLAVLNYKKQLERDSFPRLQMGFIVAVTGGVGLLMSFLLLQSGMRSMALRYPFALAVAYLVFLLLLWAWLRAKEDDFSNIPDFSNAMPNLSGNGHSAPFQSGGGGDFGGGGASGSFDGSTSQSFAGADGSAGDSIGDALGSVGDADELAIPIIAIVFALGMAVASLYVVYLAPTLFAELLVDGVLSYTLYRHLHKVETHFWLNTAFKRTVFPFILTAVFLAIVGAAMSHYAPGARSIGEVIHYSGEKR